MTFVRLIALLLAFPLLAACSKTVQWEEEVPLNTGETIWVKRSMPWVYKGGFGNPFDMAMRPTMEQTMRFTYSGKEYNYTGRAGIHWIAISPTRLPVLVAPAASFGWATDNHYYCVVPYYVQLVPDATGKQWTWPDKIEPWLYNLPANVLINIPRLKEGREERYTAKDRDERDATYRLQFPDGKKIEPLYKEVSGCIHKYDPSMKPTQTWSEK
jgi:hypothetical protein